MTVAGGLPSLTHLSIIWNGSNTAISVPRTSAEKPISINDIKPETKVNEIIINVILWHHNISGKYVHNIL